MTNKIRKFINDETHVFVGTWNAQGPQVASPQQPLLTCGTPSQSGTAQINSPEGLHSMQPSASGVSDCAGSYLHFVSRIDRS